MKKQIEIIFTYTQNYSNNDIQRTNDIKRFYKIFKGIKGINRIKKTTYKNNLNELNKEHITIVEELINEMDECDLSNFIERLELTNYLYNKFKKLLHNVLININFDINIKYKYYDIIIIIIIDF